jgi:hypothetical protein
MITLKLPAEEEKKQQAIEKCFFSFNSKQTSLLMLLVTNPLDVSFVSKRKIENFVYVALVAIG